MNFTRKKVAVGGIILVLFITGWMVWNRNLSPTKIGLINYPEFLSTKIITANNNNFVKVDVLQPDSFPNLKRYDMLIIFGMGIKLSEDDQHKLETAGEKGVHIFLYASTNRGLQLTNIKGKPFDNITDYLENGGNKNYQNLLNYIRKEIDGKKMATGTVQKPHEIASDVLFHKEEEAIFKTMPEFEKYCQEKGIHKKNNEKVLLITSVPGPFNANREHINSMIEELESRNLNVYPIAGFRGRLNYMKQIDPSLIVYMPHGRLSMGGGSAKDIEAWLKQQNVPVLCPISAFQEYDKWLKDKQGMSGGLLGQSVATPEFDGGIVPYAVFAQYKDENGLLLFKAIPNRLKKFGDMVSHYLKLTKIPNSEKKLAIVYFKGPGKNALVASNMEVLPSLHNMLLRLKKEGYDLGDLPTGYEKFKNRVMLEGPVLGPYAEGAFDGFLESGNPELVPTPEYEKWCAQTLPKESYKEVVERYGKAPGSYMAVYKDTASYIAVARVRFGNVVLLPQPLPGLGNHAFALIHGAKVAPPHTYIAPYLWVQNGWKADAIIHFGTHGSLEFTPGKQIALSSYDWTDPLIGTLPHLYVYTISNVGEAMIAKRRSYAVTQSHLTPPFIAAKAIASHNQLIDKMHKYEQAKGALKTEYALSIKKAAVDLKIHKDLGFDSILTQPYTPAEMMQLANYLEELDNEKVTGGLYTMGVPYDKKHLDETVQLMYEDALAYNLAQVDVLKGKYPENMLEHKLFFNNKYKYPSKKYINEVLRKQNWQQVYERIVPKADRQRVAQWKQQAKGKNSGYGKAYKNGGKNPHAQPSLDEQKTKLRKLVARVLTDEKKKEFLAKLESNKEYERILSLLDPETLNKARKMAKMIPAMAESIDMASDKTIHQILELVKSQELRQQALAYLSDKTLEKEVAAEKLRQDSIMLSEALLQEHTQVFGYDSSDFADMTIPELQKEKQNLDFYNKNREHISELLKKESNANRKSLAELLENDLDKTTRNVIQQLNKQVNKENEFADRVMGIASTLKDVEEKKVQLVQSPANEFETVLNSLNGGYTAPSSGGDPVANPATVPTGRNLYSVNAEHTPSKESWEVGKKLAEDLLADFRSKHDDHYPQKISFTLWSSSFIESEGTTIAQILYLLGVEPIWTPFGSVKDIRLIPLEKLGRPRIDVVVQTSGQLRDLAASRLFLINKAIGKVALEGGGEKNYVSKGVRDAEKRLIEMGFSPKKARELSTKRVFGGVNGNYGTGIMDMVENSGHWDSTQQVAQTYINNMGAVYGDAENWGEFDKGVFEAALLNTEAVVQPRQSNTWGALSLDHVYEFMGGLNLAVKEVTGNDAESYFNDFRNASSPRIQGLKEAVWVETRTTLLNPKYIKEYMQGGASSAETFAETFRNAFGWNVMKPTLMEDRFWDDLYDTYVLDQQNLGIHQFFQKQNPYALQEMTAVMLETVRKGMWKATPEQIKAMAQLHAQLVKDHEAGCSGFVCDNQKLKSYIDSKLNPALKKAYDKQITDVRESRAEKAKESVVLKKDEEKEKINTPNAKHLEKTNHWIVLGITLAVLLILVLFVRKRRKNND